MIVKSQIIFSAFQLHSLRDQDNSIKKKNSSGNCCNNVVHRTTDNFYEEIHKPKSMVSDKHNLLVIVISLDGLFCNLEKKVGEEFYPSGIGSIVTA